MATASRRWSWRGLLPDLTAAASRFPLAVILAGLFTFYKLSVRNPNDIDDKILGALAASFLWAVAVDFFAESHWSSWIARGLAYVVGVAAIALLFRFQWELWLLPMILFGGLVLLVGLSGHIGSGERNAAFWLFNHRLWLGAALGLLGAALFGAGLSIIVETLNLLFGLGIPSRWHEDIWTIALGFLAPVSALALAPRSFTETLGEREETEFTTRAIANLVRFVLVPLIFVYTAILYAYAVKIALAATLPRGTLGSMIVGYLLTGAATLLLAYPSRDSSLLVRLFWRYWVWLALMPVALLFLSVYTRISAYGLTEARYVMLLIGVWALIIAGLRIIRPGHFDLRAAPAVLALLLLAASFGPWGAIGASVNSQTRQLAALLSSKGLLVDGKIVPKPASTEGATPLGTAGARVRSIEWYLNTHHALGRLAPWFEGHDPNPFAPGKSAEQASREILEALSLRADIPSSAGVVYLTHYSDVPEVVAAGADGHVVGPVVFEGGGPVPGPIPPREVTVDGIGAVRLELADNILTAAIKDGPTLRFNIIDAARELSNPVSDNHRPLKLKASDGGVRGVVLIDNLNGTYQEPDFTMSLLRFWLVLSKAP